MEEACHCFLILAIIIECKANTFDCEGIKKAKSAKDITIESLNDITYHEFTACITSLGNEKLPDQEAQMLWELMLQGRLLGWIAKGIPPNHFLNMSFSDIDTIAAFGRYYDLSLDQLSALREAVMEQWSNKNIQDLSSFDLANLGHILCAFNASDIARIHPEAYRNAANELALLKNCSSEVIKALAKLAESPYGFGNPSQWTAIQVSVIGCVIAGVTALSSIPSDAFQGITPDMVDCMSQTVFQRMSAAQLRMIPATSSLAVRKAGLTSRQGDAVEEAISGVSANNATLTTNININTAVITLTLFVLATCGFII